MYRGAPAASGEVEVGVFHIGAVHDRVVGPVLDPYPLPSTDRDRAERLPHPQPVAGDAVGAEESKVRDRLAILRDDTLNELQEKLKAGDLSDSDTIKLASLAAKYTLRAVAYDQDLINELWDATEGALPELDPAIVERVKKAWVPVLARRLMA